MKRIALLALSLLLLVPARAQHREDFDNAVYASRDENLQFRVFSHLGYGFHFVRSDDFKARPSGEFFMNVLKLRYFPLDNLALDLGADIEYNFISSRQNRFYLDDDRQVRVRQADASRPVNNESSRGSSIDAFTINMPLLARFMVGDLCFGVGAEASFNPGGSVSSHYKVDNVTTNVTEHKARLNGFSYGLTLMADYDGAGLYMKFYPGPSARLLPAGGIDLHYWTLGIILNFD